MPYCYGKGTQHLPRPLIVRENVHQNLRAINNVLIRLIKDSPLSKDSSQYNRDLAILSDAMPGIRTLFVLDATGLIRFSNRETLVDRNFAHRDYFNTPLQRQDVGMLYMSILFLFWHVTCL